MLKNKIKKIEYIKLPKERKYKYRIKGDQTFSTPITGFDIEIEYLLLKPNGDLTFKDGYEWDGPSGPTIDTETNIGPSAFHDAFYQLIRMGLVSCFYRKEADYFFKWLCIQYGMFFVRAWYYYQGVRKFGARFAGCKY